MIDWLAFLAVAVATIAGACVVVTLYALGLRLFAAAGRAIHVDPAEFTDAIAVVTPEEAEAYAKRAKKAAKKNPLTARQRRLAIAGGYACFVVCGAAVLYGIYLVIPLFHQ